MIVRPVIRVLTAGVWLTTAGVAAAQPLGTFNWQLAPYCNVLTLAVTQIGAQYRLEGFDNQCGTAQRAAVTGLVVPNADGTLEFGLTVVSATGAVPAHIDVTFSIATLGGPWRDSAGNGGTLVFNPSTPSGNPRRNGFGAASIDPNAIQRRVTGVCATGQYAQGVNADGTVACDVAITEVNAGAGLTRGSRSASEVTLGVAFAGPGIASSVARSDHTHSTTFGNTAVGDLSLTVNIPPVGTNNTAVGDRAMTSHRRGYSNVAIGARAMSETDETTENTAVGTFSMFSLAGNYNTAVGSIALAQVHGNHNVALGWRAGDSLTDGSNNVYIANQGGTTESDTIRIGTSQTATYVAGVYGRTVLGSAVYMDNLGRLGTVLSSRRFKDQIAPLGDMRAQVQALRPVTFAYKPEFDGGTQERQYGLIAEEVDEVMPDLVLRDKDGRAETVRYQFLPTLLLAEVQRLEREHAELERRLSAQEREMAELRALVKR